MPDWTMRLQNRDGTYVGEIPFFDLQGEFRMNSPSEIRFKTSSMDLRNYVNPVTQLKGGLTEVVLLRNNVKVFVGPIWDVTATSEERNLAMMAQDLSSYLNMRQIAKDTKFTKKRYAHMAWELLQANQALPYGDLGITLGQDAVTNPTGTITFAKKSGESLTKIFQKLSAGGNGFDWCINVDRKLMMHYPRIQTKSLVSLEYPTTIRKYSMQDMGMYVANEVFMRSGTKLVSNTYSDTSSKQRYGLRQYATSDSSTKSKAKLDSMASYSLSLRKDPRLIPQLTVDSKKLNPFEGDIGYGYLINTIINDGWVQFDGIMRCSGFQLSVGKHGNETFVLYINDTREIEGGSG